MESRHSGGAHVRREGDTVSIWFVMGVLVGISVGVTLVNWFDFLCSASYADGTRELLQEEDYHGNENGCDGA